VDRIRTPDGVHRSPADISRAARPAKASINAAVLTNNFRAMTSAIARSRRRRMDGHRHAAGAGRAVRPGADFRYRKKGNPACVSAAGFFIARRIWN
jgi:hypothetical protein